MREAVVVDPELAEQERALTDGVGAVVRQLDLVEVTGDDAVKFLDGQLSQNVVAIDVGTSAWSFVLQPQGKVVALVRVTVVSATHIVLDMEAGCGVGLVERLNRFRLRVKADLTTREVAAASVRGPGTADMARPGGLVADALWPAWPGWDQLDSADLPPTATRCSPDAWEVARIRCGLPRNGLDLDEKTIPAESGLVPLAASMTKGCYVGQELVARIDSRGHVNRNLRKLDIDGPMPPIGAELVGPDKAVGVITSSAFSQVLSHPVGLGYVRREVEPGSTVAVRWAGAEAKAMIR